VSVTVATALAAVNDAATIAHNAVNPTITTLNGGGTSLFTNDTGGTGTKTISAVNGVAANVGAANVPGANGFGTFKINADGTFSYTLNESNAQVSGLAAGQTLTDTAAYTVKDQGGGSSTATLTVTITSSGT
jgi:VCBS repeat-containing protein